MAIAAVSCGGEKSDTIADINDTRYFPTMSTTDVSTFVSDSGYTRYHITAQRWIMYEEADTPFWTFPDGLFMEKYDDNMSVTATFRADSATYFSTRKIWRFDGNVNMRNVDGDRFATPQLFWDQNRRTVYSDSFMHIERTERIIEGYGFQSNEQMTEYTVLNPQMILPVDRMRADRQEKEREDSITRAESDKEAEATQTKSQDESQSTPVTNPAAKKGQRKDKALKARRLNLDEEPLKLDGNKIY